MKNGVIIVAVVIVAGLLALPLIIGSSENGGTASLAPEDYAGEMGLNQISRDRFWTSPSFSTYEETVEYLGVDGVELADPADLPPAEFGSLWERYPWPRAAEEPDMRAYLWVNEYGDLMGMMFSRGERGVMYAGPDPDEDARE